MSIVKVEIKTNIAGGSVYLIEGLHYGRVTKAETIMDAKKVLRVVLAKCLAPYSNKDLAARVEDHTVQATYEIEVES
tara:strand:- start:880 stop:1110 length:231 start_codon:yes stop_codon:yes gene_type:complete